MIFDLTNYNNSLLLFKNFLYFLYFLYFSILFILFIFSAQAKKQNKYTLKNFLYFPKRISCILGRMLTSNKIFYTYFYCKATAN